LTRGPWGGSSRGTKGGMEKGVGWDISRETHASSIGERMTGSSDNWMGGGGGGFTLHRVHLHRGSSDRERGGAAFKEKRYALGA